MWDGRGLTSQDAIYDFRICYQFEALLSANQIYFIRKTRAVLLAGLALLANLANACQQRAASAVS